MPAARRTRYVPEPSWIDRLNAVRVYVAKHGKFPAVNSENPRHAALAAWWMAVTAADNLARLSANRAKAIYDTFGLCDERDRELRAQARQQVSLRQQRVNQATARQAGRRQVAAARRALDSPYLLPGDREVLILRIENPAASLADLAEIAGMTKAAFGAKLRGASSRTRSSVSADRRPGATPPRRRDETASRDAEIAAKRDAGASVAELAAEYRLSVGGIYDILTAWNKRSGAPGRS